jgi:hypothetical protein
VPFGLLTPLAGVLVAPAFRGRHRQVGDRTTVLGAPDFRVRAQIADENDLVDATRHDVSPSNTSGGLAPPRPNRFSPYRITPLPVSRVPDNPQAFFVLYLFYYFMSVSVKRFGFRTGINRSGVSTLPPQVLMYGSGLPRNHV